MSAESDREIAEGIKRVAREDFVHFYPNRNGRFPACLSKVGTFICSRCGKDVRANKGPCPAVPESLRWDISPAEIGKDELLVESTEKTITVAGVTFSADQVVYAIVEVDGREVIISENDEEKRIGGFASNNRKGKPSK